MNINKEVEEFLRNERVLRKFKSNTARDKQAASDRELGDEIHFNNAFAWEKSPEKGEFWLTLSSKFGEQQRNLREIRIVPKLKSFLEQEGLLEQFTEGVREHIFNEDKGKELTEVNVFDWEAAKESYDFWLAVSQRFERFAQVKPVKPAKTVLIEPKLEAFLMDNGFLNRFKRNVLNHKIVPYKEGEGMNGIASSFTWGATEEGREVWERLNDMFNSQVTEAEPEDTKQDQDAGKHYRFGYRVKVTQENLDRGFIDINLDPFRIASIYKMECFAAKTILKKVLVAGNRGYKDETQDLKDIISAAERKLEMVEEDKRNEG